MDEHEWRFEPSDEMREVSQRFWQLMEDYAGTKKFTPQLRKLLNDHPDHIDALHHYVLCKLDEGKPLDAYAFAHTAVAIGKAAFPAEFRPGKDRLPGGFIENRPFLRAMHGLMMAQWAVFKRDEAIQTGKELLNYDREDRSGSRLLLAEYLVDEHRDHDALALFAEPDLKDTFDVAHYLEALAFLRLGKEDKARKALEPCLKYHPQVARFILEPRTPCPEEGSAFGGITVGSPYEGWYYGTKYSWAWNTPKTAKEFLQKLTAPIAAAGWEREFENQ